MNHETLNQTLAKVGSFKNRIDKIQGFHPLDLQGYLDLFITQRISSTEVFAI